MSKSEEPAIIVKNLSKSFKIPLDKNSGIKQLIVNFYKRRKGYREFKALNDISFEVKKGEFFGIVGRNGSGKSTLLKTLAGVYEPGEGLVSVNGSLTPFIELGVGFNPELTGRENIFLNGALLGFGKKEMEAMYDDIVDFAELHDFMEERLKNYSSGMQVRLAFSIAIRVNSDILVLDEVLAVGDEAFQKKCIEYFVSLKKEKQTVILVTHDMSNVERFCNRALVLSQGNILGIMTPSKAKKTYEQLNRKEDSAKKSLKLDKRWGSGKVVFDEVKLGNENKNPQYETGGSFSIKLSFKSKLKEQPILVGLAVEDELGINLSGPNSKGLRINSSDTVTYKVNKNPLTPGKYSVRLSVFDEDMLEEYDHIENALTFEVVDNRPQRVYGKVNLFGSWERS